VGSGLFNVGSGIAGGAATGAAFGPIGAAIGGAAGGLLGGISSLLQASEVAKQKKRMREQLEQEREKLKNDSYRDQLVDAMGQGNDPMVRAMRWDPNGGVSDEDINARVNGQFPEEQPNYAALLQQVAGAAGAVRNGMRADELDKLAEQQAARAGNMKGYAPFGGSYGGGYR
jgi:hypothetical protein